MIKAIITDVDGVIVGKKYGINFPLPNTAVINKLKAIHEKNVPIILSTVKPQSGILEIVRKADLRNPHITDGGALIIDPLDDKIINKHTLDKNLVEKIIAICIKNNIYIECYGVEDYYVQKDQVFELTEKHSLVVQQEPNVISSLEKELATKDIIKIFAFAKDKDDINRVDSLVKSFADDIHVVWTIHPKIVPFQLCVITVKGVSKKNASLKILNLLNILPEETLGIGDTLGDWNFMEICKYVATVGDESKELKDLIKAKGDGNYFYGGSVDENGILDIFSYFKL